MVGGYELSLVFPAGTPPDVVEEYFERVREKIAALLQVFEEGEAKVIASSRKRLPELWFEGTYIALLEFARDHDAVGVSIPQ